MTTLRIEYDPQTGATMADGKINAFVDYVIKKAASEPESDLRYRFGSELILEYFTAAIAKGEIDHNIVTFVTATQEYTVRSNGRWKPAGFPSQTLAVMCEILDLQEEAENERNPNS